MPVYHPLFLPQIINLLNAKCVYCSRLRIHPANLNRVLCKLRLLEHGLIEEAEALDDITLSSDQAKARNPSEDKTGDDKDEQSSDEDTQENTAELTQKQNYFTAKTFTKYGGKNYLQSLDRVKLEAVLESRRATIKDLFAESRLGKKCRTCDG